MYILGVSCFYHDAAAALLRDGTLVAAAEEERFSRKKHDFGFPNNAIDFCLRQAGITAKDLDYVVFYEKPLIKFERILMTALGAFPQSWSVFRESMIAWFKDKLWIKSLLQSKLNIEPQKILFIEHHLSHAASALFCSPFSEAATLAIDGVGEWATATIGHGMATWDGQGQNRIELIKEMHFPHSLGLLYSAFTAFLGFEVNEGEYKVMGMAPYGEPRYVDRVYQMVHPQPDGSFWLDMGYFSYHCSTDKTFSKKFEALWGRPRDPKSEFITRLTHPGITERTEEIRQNEYYADVAASIQKVTEELVLRMARQAYKETGLKKLCMAGGVALNTVANGRILNETPFEEIYIQPACGDSGGAVGAALYAYHVLLGQPRRFVMEHAYWGEGYSLGEIKQFLDANGVTYQQVEDDNKLTDILVDDLTAGKVVGWFQGRFEWGPRALGNRSILADPRRAEMKNIINSKIKFREPFRPFAPVILEDRTGEFFDDVKAPYQYPARFMLFVLPLNGDKGSRIPAVNHLGTGRLQTIRREWNPRYYQIVEKFGQATGVPVLMNTSFNLRGEPIVASPADAMNTLELWCNYASRCTSPFNPRLIILQAAT
jgi:carbamoyltransferase